MPWLAELEKECRAYLARVGKEKRPVVAYLCLYTPPELIAAAGAIPVRIFSHDRQESALAGERYSRNYFCPFAQACISQLGGKSSRQEADPFSLPGFDALVVNYGCDQMRKVAEVARLAFGIPSLVGYVPRLKNQPDSLSIYVDELKQMKTFLEQVTGRKVSNKALNYKIQSYNRLRQRALQLDQWRKRGNTHIPISYALALSEAASVLPPQRAGEFYETVLSELEDSPKRNLTQPTTIYLAGGPLCRESKVIKLLEAEFGVTVVGDDLCTGSRAWHNLVEEDNDNPLEALAKAYLYRRPCSRMKPEDERNRHLARAVAASHAQGVIYISLKFCHCYGLGAGMAIAQLRTRWPVLHIETDYSENDLGQLRTRIGAFLEIVKGTAITPGIEPLVPADKEVHYDG